MAKKKSVAKKSSSDVALYSEDKPEYIKDEGRGQENVGFEDMSIPRLDIIQAISPQLKSNDPAYIEEAEQGMLFNTVTGKLYGTEVLFIPVYFRKEWVIWKHRKAGGGFAGAFGSKEEAERVMREHGWDEETFKEGKISYEMYEIVDTAQHFGLIVDPEDGSVEEIVLSMSKSKMKVSRQLNTMVKMAGGDRFSRIYKISGVEAQNNSGDDFWNMSVKQMGYCSEPLYLAGERMYESVAAGLKDVNRDVVSSTETESAEVEDDDEY